MTALRWKEDRHEAARSGRAATYCYKVEALLYRDEEAIGRVVMQAPGAWLAVRYDRRPSGAVAGVVVGHAPDKTLAKKILKTHFTAA